MSMIHKGSIDEQPPQDPIGPLLCSKVTGDDLCHHPQERRIHEHDS